MAPLIKYSEISDLYGVACKIRTDNVSVPPHLNVDDSRCCIALMQGQCVQQLNMIVLHQLED